MKTSLVALLVLLPCGLARAEETLLEVKWDRVVVEAEARWSAEHPGGPPSGARQGLVEPTADAPFYQLRIDPGKWEANQGPSAHLWEVDLASANIKITKPCYAITGQVRCEGIEGAGFLEMLSVFADGAQYFSRGLADSGPMAALTGTSSWRAFTLPFNLDNHAPPKALLVRLHVPSKTGTIWLGPLRLAQYDRGEAPPGLGASLGKVQPWWTDRGGGLVGGLGGTLLGIAGAVVGVLTGLGRARRLVLAVMLLAVAAGLFGLALGVAAILRSQPYSVYYPLLLGGGLAVILFPALLPVVLNRYRSLEVRRMEALDMR